MTPLTVKRPAPGLPQRAPWAPAPPQPNPALSVQHDNILRRLGFWCGLCLLFVRVSMIHQIIFFETGVNVLLLYIFGIPVLLCLLGSQTLGRAYRDKIGYGWLGFLLWMVVSTVFSSWMGGSLSLVLTYVRTSLPVFLITAGFALTWRDCERIMYTIAGAGIVNVLSSRLFVHDEFGRLSMNFGSISNSNDLAAHLLFVLPFMLYVAVKPGVKKIFRLTNAIALAWGMYMVLGTASRGAFIALGAVVLVALLKGTGRQRIGLIVVGAVATVVLLNVLPAETVKRLTSFSGESDQEPDEVSASTDTRSYLLQESIRLTLHNPIVGLGPGQFSSIVGQLGKDKGLHVWQETHNGFTQISSECGIPALLFYLVAVGSAFVRINRTLNRAARAQLPEVRRMAFCILLSMVGFGVAAVFLNLSYQFYWLTLTGLALSTATTAEADILSSPAIPV